jgi:hypothetical protein
MANPRVIGNKSHRLSLATRAILKPYIELAVVGPFSHGAIDPPELARGMLHYKSLPSEGSVRVQ